MRIAPGAAGQQDFETLIDPGADFWSVTGDARAGTCYGVDGVVDGLPQGPLPAQDKELAPSTAPDANAGQRRGSSRLFPGADLVISPRGSGAVNGPSLAGGSTAGTRD
ncbi:hypothetical protein E4U54_003743 [Claviceps lovelessii]|nr:hypothetical protein E4U54_003743 [Claviceps lovelessii]